MLIFSQPKFITDDANNYASLDEMAEELGFNCFISMSMYIIPVTDSAMLRELAENGMVDLHKMLNFTLSKSIIDNLEKQRISSNVDSFSCPRTRASKTLNDYEINITLLDEITRFANSFVDHPKFGQDAKEFLRIQRKAIEEAGLASSIEKKRNEHLRHFNFDKTKITVRQYTDEYLKIDPHYLALEDIQKNMYREVFFLQILIMNTPSNHPQYNHCIKLLDRTRKGQNYDSQLQAIRNNVKIEMDNTLQIKSRSEREYKQALISVTELASTLRISEEYQLDPVEIQRIQSDLNEAEILLKRKESHYQSRQKEKLKKQNKAELEKLLKENQSLNEFNESMLSDIQDPFEKKIALTFERVRNAESIKAAVEQFANDDLDALGDANEKLMQAKADVEDAFREQAMHQCEQYLKHNLETYSNAVNYSLGIEDPLNRHLFLCEAKLKHANDDNSSYINFELEPPYSPEQIRALEVQVEDALVALRQKTAFDQYESKLSAERADILNHIRKKENVLEIKNLKLARAKETYCEKLIQGVKNQNLHTIPLDQLEADLHSSRVEVKESCDQARKYFDKLDAAEDKTINERQGPAAAIKYEHIIAKMRRAQRDFDSGLYTDLNDLSKTQSLYQKEIDNMQKNASYHLSRYNSIKASIKDAENTIKLTGNFSPNHLESQLFAKCTKHAANPDFLLRYHVYTKLLYRLHLEQYAQLCNVMMVNLERHNVPQLESEKIALKRKLFAMRLHSAELTKLEAKIIKDMKTYRQMVRNYIRHVVLVGMVLAATMVAAHAAVGSSTLMIAAASLIAATYLGYCLYQYLPLHNHQISCAPYPKFNHEKVNQDKVTKFDAAMLYEPKVILNQNPKQALEPVPPAIHIKINPLVFNDFKKLHKQTFDVEQLNSIPGPYKAHFRP